MRAYEAAGVTTLLAKVGGEHDDPLRKLGVLLGAVSVVNADRARGADG